MDNQEGSLFRRTNRSDFLGPVYLGSSLDQTGILNFFNSSSINITSFQAGNASAAVTYTFPTAGPAGNNYLLGSSTVGVMSWINAPGTYAPIGSSFVTISSDSTLTAERVLTGTSNQVIITDNGANSTVVLSLPQSINTSATPTFAGLNSSGSTVLGLSTTGNTQALQPAFLVTNSAGATDVTGDSTVFTLTWGNEIYDKGNNFASNTFTAPVTGKYLLCAAVSLNNILNTHTVRYLEITTTARAYRNTYNVSLAETAHVLPLSVIADMTANDTAVIKVSVQGSTKTVDIDNDPTGNFFSGTLLN